MNRKGFTLTELLAVIVIIAILAIGAMSGFSAMTNNSKEKSLQTKISSIETAAEKYARDNNINKKTTISVNKLVVLGYLQPDEATDSGLSVLSNPRTGENMICNTVDISFSNNEMVIKYNKKVKNCSLANEVLDTSKIGVFGYCSDDASNTLYPNSEDSRFPWVKCKEFYVRTYPQNELELNGIKSITFDVDGNSKIGNVSNNGNNVTPSNLLDDSNYVNIYKLTANDGVVTNVDVGVTYTLDGGKVLYRHVRVRIDREKPTATYVLRNDMKGSNSEREFDLYLDDASGSGPKGYYYSTDETTSGATLNEATYKTKVTSSIGTYYIIPVDNVGNTGTPIPVSVKNIPGALSCGMEIYSGNNKITNNVDWYNVDIKVNMTTDGTFDTGFTYGIIEGGTEAPNQAALKIHTTGNTPVNYSISRSAEQKVTKYWGGLWNTQLQGVQTCTIEAGIDKTKPTVSIVSDASDNYDTWAKSHKVTVEIIDSNTSSDKISGFAKTGTTYNLKYGWGLEDAAPTAWKTIRLNPDTSNTYKLTETTTKRLYVEITDDKYDSTNLMTGKYKLWVSGVSNDATAPFTITESVQDLAQNTNVQFTSSGKFYFDNTPPTSCTSSGGSDEWTGSSRTLIGHCVHDDHSGCGPDISRTISTQMDSNEQSPGNVKDAVGNERACPNQRVRIDHTPPDCIVGKSYTGTWSGSDVTVSGTCKDKGDYQSGCGTNAPGATVTGTDDALTTKTVNPGNVKDAVGNEGTCDDVAVQIDKEKPKCEIELDGTEGNNGWYKEKNVKVKFKKKGDGDGSGTVSYLLTKTQTSSPTYDNDAEKSQGNTSGVTWYGYVKDAAGNKKSCNSGSFKVDKDPPSVSIDSNAANPGCASPNNQSWALATITDNLSYHNQAPSKWNVGSSPDDLKENAAVGDEGVPTWYEGLCSGDSTYKHLYVSYSVYDKAGNHKTGTWKNY